ncbi:hypothetical protein [Sulfurimonas hydrogeniphila]|uniref:hypothetical protein n=1 Tax=Sulfurimonas hydrogeniphila TaxID=2509341 RepID=UPI00125FC9B5|nr:hypothetical protein [Sulfurimonas hydrogeniphila]
MNSLIIHNDNIIDIKLFTAEIKYPPIDDTDRNISENIVTKIPNNTDIIFIKDNLSSNYLELLGLRVAYHIRLSKELETKRYLPIVIISDLDACLLNKLDMMAKILFTKNIFLIANTQKAIENSKMFHFTHLSLEEYQTDFLKKIAVEQPKDYLSHHGIANEWSMYRWAKYLDVQTTDIAQIKNDISSMLYFKYLQEKFPIQKSLFTKHKQKLHESGKVLYIDDEWEKGWKSIFEHIFKEVDSCHLQTVETTYKDKKQEEIITLIMADIISFNPDVIILDMRLHEDDFLKDTKLIDFTGIQIFNKIKEFNPGIQIVIFTASSNSLLLDELYNYDSNILGYVKKEHLQNYNLTTQSNINKLIKLVNRGLAEKYLKDIYDIQKNMLKILKNDIFHQYTLHKTKYEKYWIQLQEDIPQIFDILSSNTSNKYPYAMLSIARSLEAILSVFITERQIDNIYWDGEECRSKKFEDRIISLMHKFGYKIENINSFIVRRNNYVHSNTRYKAISKNEIMQWFQTLFTIIKIIEKPPHYIPYAPKKVKPLHQRETIITKSGIRKKVQ